MQIREPEFKCGDKVRNLEDGHVYTVESINDYKFIQDEYWYNISDHLCVIPESALELYANKSKTVWDLKSGDKCYFVTVLGYIFPGTWNNLNAQIENRKLGNVFLTKEEAECEIERRKVETEMLRLGGRREFKNGENNYYIVCDFDSSHFAIYIFNNKSDGFAPMTIYFDSAKECRNAIETIGEEKIKKYIFGVDE